MEANGPSLSGRARLLTALGVTGLVVVVAHTLFTPRYESNDDAGMALIAAGVVLSPEPSAHMLFINPIVGKLLSGLYRRAPDVPWYALMMETVLAVSLAVSVFAALGRDKNWARMALVVLYAATFGLVSMTRLQFTVVGGAATTAAMLLWLSQPAGERRHAGVAVLCLLLVAVGTMVRAESAMCVLLLSTPLAGLELLAAIRKTAPQGSGPGRARALLDWGLQTALPGLIAVGLFASLYGYHQWYYKHSRGWEQFTEFNRLRGQFTDCRYCLADDGVDEALARVGWSRNDYGLLAGFFFCDREVFSRDKIRAVLATCPRVSNRPPALRDQLEPYWHNRVLRGLAAVALLPAIFLTSLAAGVRWLSVTLLAGAVIVLPYVLVQHYCPPHFLQMVFAFLAICGAAWAGPIEWGWLTGAIRSVACLGVAVAFVPGADRHHRANLEAQVNAAHLRAQLEQFAPKREHLYVVWGAHFPYEWWPPYASLNPLRSLRVFPLSCLTNTGITDRRLQEFGVADLVTEMATRPDLFLMFDNRESASLIQFYRDHRGMDVEIVPVRVPVERSFAVYQVRRRGEAPPTSNTISGSTTSSKETR